MYLFRNNDGPKGVSFSVFSITCCFLYFKEKAANATKTILNTWRTKIKEIGSSLPAMSYGQDGMKDKIIVLERYKPEL